MKSAYDYAHVKSVSAWALLFDGKEAGKIVCNWTDNPNGSGCVMTVSIWRGPINDWTDESVTALDGSGAGGYDKFSGAFSRVMRKIAKFGKIPQDVIIPDLHGRGSGAIRRFLENLEYQVFEVI